MSKGLDALLGGWRIAGVARLSSGSPLTITSGHDSDGNRNNGQSARPNRVSSGIQPTQPEMGTKGIHYPWFDPTAFEPVPCVHAPNCNTSNYGFLPFQPGNAGRNILDGPGSTNLDLSMSKEFAYSERVRLGVRLEAFDALNMTNRQRVFTDMSSRNNFGKLAPFNDFPRRVQLGLRLSF